MFMTMLGLAVWFWSWMRGWANANTNKNLHTVNIQGMWLNVGAKDPARQERAWNAKFSALSLKFGFLPPNFPYPVWKYDNTGVLQFLAVFWPFWPETPDLGLFAPKSPFDALPRNAAECRGIRPWKLVKNRSKTSFSAGFLPFLHQKLSCFRGSPRNAAECRGILWPLFAFFAWRSDFSPFCCEFVQIPPFTPSLAQNTSKTRFSLKFFPVASEFWQNRPDAKFAILKIREVVLLIKSAKGPQTRPFSQSTQKPTRSPPPSLWKTPSVQVVLSNASVGLVAQGVLELN